MELEKLARFDSDALVRRTAWRALFSLDPAKDQQSGWIVEAAGDPDPLVRRAALEEAAVRFKAMPVLNTLLREATRKESDPEVRRIAAEALWPFRGETRSLLQRVEYADLAVKPLPATQLPLEGWSFAKDPDLIGHLQRWHEAAFQPLDWVAIGVGKPWQAFGHDYEGVGWYRLAWQAPPRPEGIGFDLVFGAVDFKAWVWVNGVYLGSHEGWDNRFGVDVGDHLQWGALNQIVVRVEKLSGSHAGIWKPVFLQPYTFEK